MLKRSGFLMSFVLILAGSGLAQQTWISGRVYLPNGQPMERTVRVDLRGPRAINQTLETVQAGSFSFRVQVQGEYTVTVDAGEEFETATQSIVIDNLVLIANGMSEGRSSWINIYLKEKKTAIVPSGTLDAKLANVPKKALDRFLAGSKLASANKLPESIVEFQKAIEAYPAFYQAQVELGKVYLKLARFEDAISSFRSALKTEPNDHGALLHLGVALLNLKRLAEAEPELGRAAELDTASVQAPYYLGVIKYEQGGFDAAVTFFEKARELNGTKPFPMLHKYLAGSYIKKERWRDAGNELEIYLREAPDAKDAENIRTTISQLKARSN